MRILLAVDDSKFSEAATQALIAQARPNGTEVQLLHVVEPIRRTYLGAEGAYDIDWPALDEEHRKQGKALVERTAKALQAAGFKVTTVVQEGDARSQILDAATKWPADLVIVGSHGRKGLNRFFLGSVSEAVARHASCSVEIVRLSRG